MKFTIAAVLFLATGHSATLAPAATILQDPAAQTQVPDSISGHIQDSGGKPVMNVRVSIVFPTTQAILATTNSDHEGNYVISARTLTREISKFRLEFEKEGYWPIQLNSDEIFTKSSKVDLITLGEHYCLIGDFDYKIGAYGGASIRYQQAVEHQPELVAANDGLGRSLERRGMYAEAIAVYRDFISKFPDSPAVTDFKARILEIQNKK